jgi:hypothetical protein
LNVPVANEPLLGSREAPASLSVIVTFVVVEKMPPTSEMGMNF